MILMFKTSIIALVGLIIFAGFGYFITRTQSESTGISVAEQGMVKDEGIAQDKMKDEKMMGVDGAMMKKEDMTIYAGTVLAGTSAPLLDFNKADYDAAIASDKLIVLYFYANWCPICKAEFPLAQAVFNQLHSDKVIGFRVNYKDSDTDKDEENLARQFGVPYQHTKVFVKHGQQILKAPDGWDTARYSMEINKALAQ